MPVAFVSINYFSLWEIFKRLRWLRGDYEKLPEYKKKLVDDLTNNARANQLRKFLEQYRIADAQISGIGSGRTITLRAHGIETAADIEAMRIYRINGFGSALTSSLLWWRQSIESKFVFNSHSGISLWELERIEDNVKTQEQSLQTKMINGVAQMKQIIEQPLSLSYPKVFLPPLCLAVFLLISASSIHSLDFNQNANPVAAQSNLERRLPTNAALQNSNNQLNFNINNNASQAILKSAADYFQDGINLTKAKNFAAAVETYKNAVSLNDNYPEAWHELGYAYYRLNKLDKAKEALNKSLSLRPGNPDSQNVLGQVYLAQKDLDKAAEIFEKIVKSSPDDFQANYNLGQVYLAQKKCSEAISLFELVIKKKADWAQAHYQLGLAHTECNNTEMALEEYQILLRSNPKLAEKLSSKMNVKNPSLDVDF